MAVVDRVVAAWRIVAESLAAVVGWEQSVLQQVFYCMAKSLSNVHNCSGPKYKAN